MKKRIISNRMNYFKYEYIYFFIIFLLVCRKYVDIISYKINGNNSIISTSMYLIAIITTIMIIINNRSIRFNYKIIILNIIVFILTKESSILIYFLLAIAAKNIDDDKIVKYYFGINLFFFMSFIIMNIIGLIPISEYIHYRIINGVQVQRADFGFGNPNAVFFNLIPIVAAYIYLRFDKYNNIDRFIIFIVSTFIYFETYSRNGYLTIIIIMIFVEIIKRTHLINSRFFGNIISLSPIILFIVSIFIGMFMNKLQIMDTIMSGRPRIWNFYINNLSILGTRYLEEGFPLDNSYIYILVFGGILLVIFLSTILYICIKKVIKKRNIKLIVVTVMFLIYGFNETILLDRAINFSFILLFKNVITYNNISER